MEDVENAEAPKQSDKYLDPLLFPTKVRDLYQDLVALAQARVELTQAVKAGESRPAYYSVMCLTSDAISTTNDLRIAGVGLTPLPLLWAQLKPHVKGFFVMGQTETDGKNAITDQCPDFASL